MVTTSHQPERRDSPLHLTEPFGSERFVTLIAAVVSLDERRIDYVNAGHPSGLLVAGAGGLTALSSTGPLVSSALRGCTWEQRCVPFEAGDLLLLYTDGVSDALGGDDDAIAQLVQQHTNANESLLDSILAHAREQLGGRPQPDDLTLLSVRR
jgi:sigma-B regulation protein RsbU (phosphoserine phosphatase)